MPDYDPESIPVQPAATVMLMRERREVEVLMLRRNARSVFVGDMWVFPGGGVDQADRDLDLYGRIRGLDLNDARARLELDDAPAYWIATIRETFEEAGVLVALDNDSPIDPKLLVGTEMNKWRDRLNDGSTSMRALLDATGLELDGSQFEYAARFVTPVGPPRRYDARFFVAHMPDEQVASVDNDEAVHHEWIAPERALHLHAIGEMSMMTPTVALLRRLTRYDSAEHAISTARSGTINEQMRVDTRADENNRIVFADDPRYHRADGQVELGWLRI